MRLVREFAAILLAAKLGERRVLRKTSFVSAIDKKGEEKEKDDTK